MFKFEEYCFIKLIKYKIQVLKFSKWKFKIQYVWLVETFDRSIEVMGKMILELLPYSIAIRFLFDWSKRAFNRFLITLDRSRLVKTEFSIEFFGNCFERLKMFQALWTVLWNVLTFHTCLLMKYNLMGINSGLCSLDNYYFFSLPKT